MPEQAAEVRVDKCQITGVLGTQKPSAYTSKHLTSNMHLLSMFFVHRAAIGILISGDLAKRGWGSPNLEIRAQRKSQ